MPTSTSTSQELLSRKALAVSLAPPRAPPIGSAHRALLLGKDPSLTPWREHYRVREENDDDNPLEPAHSCSPHETLRQRLRQRLARSHYRASSHSPVPHPHLAAGPEWGDALTRLLGLWLPLPWQNKFRDRGTFRGLADTLVTASAPLVPLASPRAALDFVHLSRTHRTLKYGPHPQHTLDLYMPQSPKHHPSRVILFMHGGAWGSGRCWMYRLVARGLQERGRNWAVVVYGYRTYPDATAAGQVEDTQRVVDFLANHTDDVDWRRCKNLPVTIMGHSSGAHVTLLWLVQRVQEKQKQQHQQQGGKKNRNNLPPSPSFGLPIDSYVGLSGPYDISHHFDFEAARGVEEISPMKPACGYTRKAFTHHSPALRLRSGLVDDDEANSSSNNSNNLNTKPCSAHMLPPMLLVHGVEDETVPFTSTGEAARILRSCGVTSCQEVYLDQTVHQETVMHLMLGGKTLHAVVDWISKLHTMQGTTSKTKSNATKTSLVINSRL